MGILGSRRGKTYHSLNRTRTVLDAPFDKWADDTLLADPSQSAGESAREFSGKFSARAALAQPENLSAKDFRGQKIFHGKSSGDDGEKCRFLLPGTCEPRLTRLSARA